MLVSCCKALFLFVSRKKDLKEIGQPFFRKWR